MNEAVASRVTEGYEIVVGGLHGRVEVCLVVDVGAESLEWERRAFGGLVEVALCWILIIVYCNDSMALYDCEVQFN